MIFRNSCDTRLYLTNNDTTLVHNICEGAYNFGKFPSDPQTKEQCIKEYGWVYLGPVELVMWDEDDNP